MSKRLNPVALAGGEEWTAEQAAELQRHPGSDFTCPHCGQILKLMVSRGNRPRALGFPRWEHQAYDAEACQSIRRRETWLPVGAVWPAGKAEDPE